MSGRPSRSRQSCVAASRLYIPFEVGLQVNEAGLETTGRRKELLY
ncbi:MAG: hypothetical protein ACHBN1_36945 [Heteroscytonema crispum UTEX LB 1556]